MVEESGEKALNRRMDYFEMILDESLQGNSISFAILEKAVGLYYLCKQKNKG